MRDVVQKVNLGDIGFVSIRDGVIVYKLEIQQKGLDYPFQIGNGVKFEDSIVAQEINVTIRTWDVIVIPTDGLFNNVHNKELEKLIRDGLAD